MTPLTTRILLADDHAVVRRGLAFVLDAEPDLEVVAEAGDGVQAVELAESVDAELAVLDVAMPRMTGLQAAAELTRTRPEMAALFPGYLKELKHAGFVPGSLDDAIEKRGACRDESVGDYMTTDHVEVGSDFSDAQLAEIFLHHRVLIVPVTDAGGVHGVVTRADFFRRLGERFLERD